MVVEKKKTLGRRKIEMKKIEKLSNRQVTFCKRRVGLFKKASEICVLTGAEIAIIVQSLAGKRVFAFGHSSVDSVIDRFENRIRVCLIARVENGWKENVLQGKDLPRKCFVGKMILSVFD